MKNLKTDQIAVSNFPYYKYSLDYALDSLARMGGKNLEFYACDPHLHMDDASVSDIKTAARKVRENGLKTICVTPEQCNYPVNIASANIAARKRSIAVYVKAMETAVEMDCQLCQFLAGFGCLDEADEDIWKRSVESLGYLADLAETYGIHIALETSPKEYTCLTDSIKIADMVNEVGSSALYGMIDTAVLGYSHETIQDAIAGLENGRILRHVHVGDGKPNGHFIVGEGNLNLKEMMSALDQIKYEYAISLEILNPLYTSDPEYAMKTSYERLKKIIE